MEKEATTIGLSRDFIIHPGETLEEVLEDREMSQRELAIRTGMTEKHISTVIHGQKPISVAFAKKLEYALGIEASFWINLQSNYDRELLEFEELNNISEQELSIQKNLKEVIDCWHDLKWIDKNTTPANLILDLRKLFGVSNLVNITKINYNGAYRAQVKNTNIDPYVVFAWQRMCELLTQNIDIADKIDIEKLKEKIPEIKACMFLRVNQVQKKLTAIFAECGIAFKIVPNFKGAPVQGFIKKSEKGTLILCLTLRQKFADIFWFTLFHEISHILNGDAKNNFVDFDSISSEIENRADKMASEFLINEKAYKSFKASGQYKSDSGIKAFSDSQKVQKYIVIGRLMKDGTIPWSAKNRLKYNWA